MTQGIVARLNVAHYQSESKSLTDSFVTLIFYGLHFYGSTRFY
jgi:hypothetical protein